jgi:hypothetical protein
MLPPSPSWIRRSNPRIQDETSRCLRSDIDVNPHHYIVSTSDEPEAVWVSEVSTCVAAQDASLETGTPPASSRKRNR